MDKKQISIILIAAIAILAVAGSIVYFTYVADYTYQDDRISVTVPTQTKFSVNAYHNDYWTGINYSSNDKNNISIKLLKLDNTGNISLFGVPIDVFGMMKSATIKELTTNKSYKEVNMTENYTVYYNKEKDNYIALFFDMDKKIVIMISCDGSSELINKLASSFMFKAFNTNGLVIEKINSSSIGNNSSNVSKKSTSVSASSKKDKYDQYLQDAINDPRGDGTTNSAMSKKEFYEYGQDKYYK
ncbi:MAG: hypothetical protein ACRC1M_05620 [Methanobacteriaceae archaeon]